MNVSTSGAKTPSSSTGSSFRPRDIKRQEQWEETIGSTYPGSHDTPVIYHGVVTTPEYLGNYTFGYIGNAMGIPLSILYAGSYYAADLPTSGDDLKNELNDWNAINDGYYEYKDSIQ